MPGCSFLLGPDTAYRVNDDVIAAASRAAGFAVDSDLYEVERTCAGDRKSADPSASTAGFKPPLTMPTSF